MQYDSFSLDVRIFPTLQDEFAFRGGSVSGSYLCAAEKLLNPGTISWKVNTFLEMD